jgi:hypothetical protein
MKTTGQNVCNINAKELRNELFEVKGEYKKGS